MENKIEELENYAYLDDTEWGSTLIALCNLWHCRAFLSTELLELLEEEISTQLNNAKENVEIVTETINHTYTNQHLEWK